MAVQELIHFRAPREMLPETSLAFAIYEGFTRMPSKPLIVGSDKTFTYAESYQWMNMFAWHLRFVLGIDADSTVLVSLSNIAEFPLILAALQMFGLRIALLSSTAEKDDFKRAVDLLNPQLVIVGSERHCAFMREVKPNVCLLGINCRRVAVLHIEDMVKRKVSLSTYMLDCNERDDSEIILFSSGTTGKPKAIVNHSSSFRSNALKLTASLGVDRQDILYVPVPFSHVYGLIGTYAALVRGATVVTGEHYTPESSLSLVMNARVTVYFGVTTMYLREMRINTEDDWDLSSLRIGMVAGASCPEAALVEYESRYGCRLVQSYGMTETAATLTVCSLDDPASIRSKSVGIPIPGVQMRLDPSTQEIEVRTPAMMQGVITDEGLSTPGLFRDGWLCTGDMGEFDDEGRLYITGRIKDIIIRGGINIFPAEIENIYQSHPAVAECCLVGYPDPELGERTCLCTVLKGIGDDSAHDMRLYARGRIEKCKIPDTVLKMEDLPRLPNGKIDKNLLRKNVREILSASRKPRV